MHFPPLQYRRGNRAAIGVVWTGASPQGQWRQPAFETNAIPELMDLLLCILNHI
jgi:hypothetical protein